MRIHSGELASSTAGIAQSFPAEPGCKYIRKKVVGRPQKVKGQTGKLSALYHKARFIVMRRKEKSQSVKQGAVQTLFFQKSGKKPKEKDRFFARDNRGETRRSWLQSRTGAAVPAAFQESAEANVAWIQGTPRRVALRE